MAVRNQQWYNQNESRPYPLHDRASAVDDAGQRLPSNVVADLVLRFPAAAGEYAYLSAVTVSENIATVTFTASVSPDERALPVPLGAVQVVRPEQGVWYPIDALYPGVGGWIVFGGGLEMPYSGRFASPAQSLLSQKAARPYRQFPIDYLGKLHQNAVLTGLVSLKAGTGIEILPACRRIPGYEQAVEDECEDDEGNRGRRCIVIRLSKQVKDRGALFAEMAGPCGAPETRTCGPPEPIEAINGVLPDCDGNVILEFAGCAVLSEILQEVVLDEQGEVQEIREACGVVIDCGLGLADVCVTPDRLPGPDGRLPNEYDDLCVSEESVSEVSESVWEYPFSISITPEMEESDSLCDTFDDFSGENPTWYVRSGTFFLEDGVYTTDDPEFGHVLRHVALYADPTLGVLLRTTTTRVILLQGTAGAKHNASLIFNYLPKNLPADPAEERWFAAGIDWDGQSDGYKSFGIRRYNGDRLFSVISVPVAGLTLGDEYEIAVTIRPKTNLRSTVTAVLSGITDPAVGAVIGPIDLEIAADDEGYFGLHAGKTCAQFTQFSVDCLYTE